ncbi:hypothetical protein EON79_08725 [bacterium]|nr:MAG: hypothetical protein EON79_08725 [bacterium]
MGPHLRALVGRTVLVWTSPGGSSVKDEGVFEEFDGIFVRIRSGEDTLYFPYTAIRLIKVVN